MVNHVMTWLLNVSPSNGVLPGELFIEPVFRPVSLENMSQRMWTIREILFPSRDREKIFAAGSRYLSIIKFSNLGTQLKAKDSRTTDDVHSQSIKLVGTDESFGISVKELVESLEWVTGDFFTDEKRRATWSDGKSKVYDRLAALLLEVSATTEASSRSTIS